MATSTITGTDLRHRRNFVPRRPRCSYRFFGSNRQLASDVGIHRRPTKAVGLIVTGASAEAGTLEHDNHDPACPGPGCATSRAHEPGGPRARRTVGRRGGDRDVAMARNLPNRPTALRGDRRRAGRQRSAGRTRNRCVINQIAAGGGSHRCIWSVTSSSAVDATAFQVVASRSAKPRGKKGIMVRATIPPLPHGGDAAVVAMQEGRSAYQ